MHMRMCIKCGICIEISIFMDGGGGGGGGARFACQLLAIIIRYVRNVTLTIKGIESTTIPLRSSQGQRTITLTK